MLSNNDISRRAFVAGAAGLAAVWPKSLHAQTSAQLGVAMTPANFPKQSAEDMQDMFRKAKAIGPMAILIYQWGDGNFLNVAKEMTDLCRKNGMTPNVALSPTTLDQARGALDVPGAVRSKAKKDLSFKNPDVHRPYIAAAMELAKLKPPYLCLATEINFLAFKNIQEYVTFAGVYQKMVPELKKISPDTKMYVSFQWDFFHVMAKQEPKKTKEHAKLFEVFMPAMDIVGLTSYPAEHFKKPSEIPADYYKKIYEYIPKDKKVGFTELGWPSTGKGDERSQEEYIKRLPELMNPVAPEFIAWSLLHDVRIEAFGDALGTTGLLDRTGKPKPAYEAFRQIKR